MKRQKNRENIMSVLTNSDISFIAKISNVSYSYVFYIIKAQRCVNSEKAKKIVELIKKRVKQNKELLKK